MQLKVGTLKKNHRENGVGTIDIPISIIDDLGKELKSSIITREINFSMYDENAERIFKQTPDETMMDLVNTVRKELEADIIESEYVVAQKEKLNLFPEEKFRLALESKFGNVVPAIVPQCNGRTEIPETLPNISVTDEKTITSEPTQNIISKIVNRVTSIFRG